MILDPHDGVDRITDDPKKDGPSQDDPFVVHTQKAASGLRVEWIGYGAHLQSVRFPDGTHVLARLNNSRDYAGEHPYVGSLIGRVANRIANSQFSVDGQDIKVTQNEDQNALHSGPDGFDRQNWSVDREGEILVFRYSSPAGHQNYPGNLDVSVRSQLSDRALKIQLIAITDAATPVNLTQHGYWNPAGLFGRKVDQLRLRTPADRYTQVGPDLIPTGQTLPTAGSAFDFRESRPVGTATLDVNVLVPGEGLREMARLTDGTNSITILSDYPGFQLYTGDTLGGVADMQARAGLAIEPQYPPDAINQANQPFDIILRPGEVYRHTIIYQFDGPSFTNSETP